MTTLDERKRRGRIIQARRREQGETQESLAEALGLSQAFVGKLERGAANVDAMQIKNFAALLERLRWSPAEFSEATGIPLGPLLGSVGGGAARGGEPLRRVEVYSPASARETAPEGAEYRTHTYLSAQDAAPGVELYVAQGDSMTTSDPESIHAGDILHVNTHRRDVQPGRVYLLRRSDDGMTVRRAREVGGELWMMSDNPAHAAFRAEGADVIGRVEGWTRTIRP